MDFRLFPCAAFLRRTRVRFNFILNNSSKRKNRILKHKSIYETIYKKVSLIPYGRVSTYGRIARQVENCTARMVGYAMARTPANTEIPWHRVINSQGKISIRSHGEADDLQRRLLISEGIEFGLNDSIILEKYLWDRE